MVFRLRLSFSLNSGFFSHFSIKKTLLSSLWVGVLAVAFSAPLPAADKVKMVFSGIEEGEILDFLKELTKKQTDKGQNTFPSAALRRRADSELPIINEYLKSNGYYSAHVDYSIDPHGHPPLINYQIELGPLYTIERVIIVPVEAVFFSKKFFLQQLLSKDFSFPPFAELGEPYSLLENKLSLKAQDPAKASSILQGGAQVVAFLKELGYPFAKVIERKVIVDTEHHNSTVAFMVMTGPKVKFGKTTIKGLDKVRKRVVLKRISWQEGSFYNQQLVQKTQERLEKVGLFQSVQITYPKEGGEGELLPLLIDVKESPPRLFRFGLSYAADKGGGVIVEWAHHNMRGIGERLSYSVDLTKAHIKGTISYLQPNFFRDKEHLKWAVEYDKNNTAKSFKDVSTSLSAALEGDSNEPISYSIGMAVEFLRSFELLEPIPEKDFTLFKLPMQVKWSETNNLLQPTSGAAVIFSVTPTQQLFSPTFLYLNSMATGILYTPLNSSHSVSLASKFKVGAIHVLHKNHTVSRKYPLIPPTSRLLYSGSEDTFRGYAYQKVSPLGLTGEAIGGRSLVAMSLELRVAMTPEWGWVAFYEAGNVSEFSTPSMWRKTLQSVGAGLRYQTPIGPLRLDIACPLNRRQFNKKWIDNRFEIYFNIGQTF